MVILLGNTRYFNFLFPNFFLAMVLAGIGRKKFGLKFQPSLVIGHEVKIKSSFYFLILFFVMYYSIVDILIISGKSITLWLDQSKGTLHFFHTSSAMCFHLRLFDRSTNTNSIFLNLKQNYMITSTRIFPNHFCSLIVLLAFLREVIKVRSPIFHPNSGKVTL